MRNAWALKVLSFDSERAVKSLNGQLLLLRALTQQVDGVSLTWRLSVGGEGKQRGSASLLLLCQVDDSASISDGSLQELESLASVVLATGHSLSRFSTERLPATPRSRRHLILDRGTLPPIKPDWAILVDLLRHRGAPAVIDITCRSHSGEGTSQGREILVKRTLDQLDSGIHFLSEIAENPSERQLLLEVVVGTRSPADPVLLDAVAQLVLGSSARHLTPKQAQGDLLCLPPEVALRVWHSPYERLQGRGLSAAAPTISSSHDLSDVDGVELGLASVQGPDWDRPTPLRISIEERLRHIYVVGKTGVGKTNLLKHIAQQDIEAGHGVAVLSPHSDLIDHLLAVAENRLEEVTLLDFGDADSVPVLNPLTMDVERDTDFPANAARVIDLFAKRTFNQFSGPVFVDSVRLAIETLETLQDSTGYGPSLVAAVEMIRSDKLQRWAAKALKDTRPDLAEEWERIFNMRGSEAAEASRWVTAKFSDLGAKSALRAITTDVKPSPLSLRRLYREGGILLVKLPETQMSSSSVQLLGNLIFSQIFREAQLAGIDRSRPFFLHVDEFQRFVTGDLEELVAEARKFKLGLTFAHQNLRQLEAFSVYEGTTQARLAEAIFANVGTVVAMKTSGRDVSQLAQELSVKEAQIRGLARGQAVVRTTHEAEDVVCTIHVPLVASPPHNPQEAVTTRMCAEGTWRDSAEQHRQVEAMLDQLRRLARDRQNPFGTDTTSRGSSGSNGTSFVDEWLAKKQRGATSTEPESPPTKTKTMGGSPLTEEESSDDEFVARA